MALTAKEETELKEVSAKRVALKALESKVAEKNVAVDAANNTRATALAAADTQYDGDIATLQAAFDALP